MQGLRIHCTLLALGLLSACLAGRAGEDRRDEVAAWETQRVTLDMRVRRLPARGAAILWLPVGTPPPAKPRRLTAERIEAVIEKLDFYSGPESPVRIDGVVLEINAIGDLDGAELMAVEKLLQVLQVHDYPVIAWVHETALDEAAWVALSADRIFMHRQARLGGAPADPLRDSAERIDSQLRRLVKEKARFAGSVAVSKGFNSDLVRAMVDGSEQLRRAAIDGRPYLLTDDTLDALKRQRPGAVIESGAVYKKSGDRLLLGASEALKPECAIAQAMVDSREQLFEQLGIAQVQMIELPLGAAPPSTIAGGSQTAILAGLVFLVLLLVVTELVLETRGYAFTAGGGLMLSYFSWAAARTPMGGIAFGLFLAAVVMFIFELFRPSRSGRLGVFSFALIGFSLALTLIQDAPFLDAGWSARHLAAEYRPALQNTGLVLGGGTLAAAAVGLMTLARLRRMPRYSRRWRKRHAHWDDSTYLELQRQRGRRGVTLTPIAPPPGGSDAGTETPAQGRVSLEGRQYEATCVGSIAGGQEIEVVDCTEERLIVRRVLQPRLAVPAWQAPSKYEAPVAGTKYPIDPAGPGAGTKYTAEPDLPAGTILTAGESGDPSAEIRKYPAAAEGRKYRSKTERSKYTPPGGTTNGPGAEAPPST